MLPVPAGFSIEQFDPDTLDDRDSVALLDLTNTIGRERRPRSKPLGKEEMILFMNSPGQVRTRFMARNDQGHLIGQATGGYADDGTNPDTLSVSISVLPDYRRIGLGSTFLARLVDIAQDSGRTQLTSYIMDTVDASDAFLVAVGGVRTVEHHENYLRLEELDPDLLTNWVAEGPRHAPGYVVGIIEGPYPEEILEEMAHLYFVLERDMPTPDGQEPRTYDAKLVKEFVGHFLQGGEMLTAIATREDSGRVAGMSQLYRRHADPSTWMVTTTMVDPEHRGFSLGKWLKGAVNLRALSEWPDGVYQETGNAQTNEAMLAINHAMGFEPELTLSEVMVTVESAQSYLSSRRA